MAILVRLLHAEISSLVSFSVLHIFIFQADNHRVSQHGLTARVSSYVNLYNLSVFKFVISFLFLLQHVRCPLEICLEKVII
jgi:hypothetical protein